MVGRGGALGVWGWGGGGLAGFAQAFGHRFGLGRLAVHAGVVDVELVVDLDGREPGGGEKKMFVPSSEASRKAEAPPGVPPEIKETQPLGTTAVPAPPEEAVQVPVPSGSCS